MKRREFLSIPATALGGTLLYTLAGEPFHLHAQNGQVKVPLRFFTVEHFGQPGRPKPQSLEQIMGRKPTPWEDEKG